MMDSPIDSSTNSFISRKPIVASRVQMTHRLSVTPAFPMPCLGADSSSVAMALLICPSRVATRPRYALSSFPSADRKLCPTRPPSVDSTNSARPRYSNDGSAKVCRRLMRGTGRVGGSFSAADDANVRFVDDSPWSVKGKSRRSDGSEGCIGPYVFGTGGVCGAASSGLAASAARFSRTLDGLSGFSVDASRLILGSPVTGSFNNPGFEKASLNAGLSTTNCLSEYRCGDTGDCAMTSGEGCEPEGRIGWELLISRANVERSASAS